jgi:hypothetical protein
MRNVVRLGLIMLVAAIALSAPKVHADVSTLVLPSMSLSYQDNEGAGTLFLTFLDPTDPTLIAVTIDQGDATLSGEGTLNDVLPIQSDVEFSLRQDVGGVPTGPTYIFSGTLFKDATGKVIVGGGTYTLQGAPGPEFIWFVH